MRPPLGMVYLVGAGPGDPALITVRGRALLESADVIVYDRLIPSELLTLAKQGAELINVGKAPGEHLAPQDQIEQTLIDHAKRGRLVVRLKGGDPFVFGRGFEEWRACQEAGVPCVVVSGVSSAIAGPAAAGIPVTLRGIARSFAIVTAKVAPDEPDVDFGALVGVDTLVVLMGRARLAEVAQGLLSAGRDPSTPAACIQQATTPGQRVVRATLGTIAEAADREGLAAPMITVVGEVAGLAEIVATSSGLAGKRVLVTKSAGGSSSVVQSLLAAGARPIICPLIEIRYADTAAALRQLQLGSGRTPARPDAGSAIFARSGLDYDWAIFSSVHGVQGFWRTLRAAGQDARALALCKVAAVGPATAHALRRRGISPDLVPAAHTGAALADAMFRAGASKGQRVLFPKGNLGGAEIAEGLRGGGVEVDEVVVYSTVDATPSRTLRDQVAAGVDAILFLSPSAVRRFVQLHLPTNGAAIGCIGPTTAKAAAEHGLRANVVPTTHTSAGLVSALADLFRSPSIATLGRAAVSPGAAGIRGSRLGL